MVVDKTLAFLPSKGFDLVEAEEVVLHRTIFIHYQWGDYYLKPLYFIIMVVIKTYKLLKANK